jgi:hypothetical protein
MTLEVPAGKLPKVPSSPLTHLRLKPGVINHHGATLSVRVVADCPQFREPRDVSTLLWDRSYC